jgi:hypothetical protein
MLIEIIILALGIPAGFLIAYWANDELIQGRKWFTALLTLSVIAGFWSIVMQSEKTVAWTAGFSIIVATISLWKSHDKKWTKRRV